MSDGDAKEKRRQTYLRKYGGEEGYRAEMRRRQQNSMLNPNRMKGRHKGGFNYKSKEELKEISRKGVIARGDKWVTEGE